MFDIFWQLPTSGNLSPDKATFTILINALRNRKALHTEDGAATPAGAQADVWRRNADDIRFIWKQLVSASERKRFRLDGLAIAPTLFALAKGSPEAQEEAFSIVHDYLGFSPSAEEVPRRRRVDLSPQLLTAALELCVMSGQHERCLHYVRSVMANPTDAQSAALSNRHMHYAFDSLAALSASASADPQSALTYSSEAVRLIQRTLQEEQKGGFRLGLRLDITTYSKVFLICRRAKDWASARRLFELMTGYRLDDLKLPLIPADASGRAGVPTNSTVPRRFQILPDAGIMNLVIRSAFASATSSSQSHPSSTPSASDPINPKSPYEIKPQVQVRLGLVSRARRWTTARMIPRASFLISFQCANSAGVGAFTAVLTPPSPSLASGRLEPLRDESDSTASTVSEMDCASRRWFAVCSRGESTDSDEG